MTVKLFKEPQLHDPVMLVGWPGIGNVGLIAIDSFRHQLEAEPLGEIEPWEFFYPSGVIVHGGIQEELAFPGNRFYYKHTEDCDLLFFIGEEQPVDSGTYAQGSKAYEMADLVLDVASRFGCKLVFTSGAAVVASHHSDTPGVWLVANGTSTLEDVRQRRGSLLVSQMEGIQGQASITGLNGLLLGVAQERQMPAACLMGEVPDYLSQVPIAYPRAAHSVLDVLMKVLSMSADLSPLDNMTEQVNAVIEDLYQKFPSVVRERLEKRRSLRVGQAITEEDQRWLKEHIGELFQRGESHDRGS